MIGALFERLVGNNIEDRYRAGRELHLMGRDALNGALALAASEEALARDMACFVLGRVLDDRVEHQDVVYPTYYRDGIPVLLRLLDTDPEPSVRGSAAIALGFLSSVEALPSIVRHGYSTVLDLRFNAVLALSTYDLIFWNDPLVQHRKPSVIQVLLQRLEDQNSEVRSWSVFTLYKLEAYEPHVRRAVARLLHDPHIEVRNEVEDYLAAFKEERETRRLHRARIWSPSPFGH